MRLCNLFCWKMGQWASRIERERHEGDRQEADCQVLSSASNWRGQYTFQCRTEINFPEVTETLSLIWTVLKRAWLTSILIGRYIYKFKYFVTSENMDFFATSLISFWYSRIFSLFKFYQFIVRWIVLSTRLCNKPSFVQKWILTLCRRAESLRERGRRGSWRPVPLQCIELERTICVALLIL